MSCPPVDPTLYDDAITFLYSRLNYERTEAIPYSKNEFKLDCMRRLLELLGNPHDQLAIVHIAGTKGKGSTSYDLAAILRAAGYRTGCYTSPHLQHIEERFAVQGEPCQPEELVRLVAQVRPFVEQLDREASVSGVGSPTFFEVTTAMAFLHFQQRRTDWVVLEVGLGGRLDSTNVCHPRVSVITTISFDHMRQLGNTLPAIAREKAGIIKPGVPVITGVRDEGAWEVIRDIATSQGCAVQRIGESFDVHYHTCQWTDRRSRPKMDFLDYGQADGVKQDGPQGPRRVNDIELAAWGSHQANNAGLAWAVCDELARQGVVIPEEARRRGLAQARCPGRIEVVSDQPLVLLDTAHNVASIEALLRVLEESFPHRPRGLILAATQGKDVTGMLHGIVRAFDVIVCTRYLQNPRTVPQDELMRAARRIATAEGCVVAVDRADTPQEAWEQLSNRIPAHGLICVTGSFFLAAEIQPLLCGAAQTDVAKQSG